MTTPSGYIQASDVNAELGRAWNQYFSMDDGAVRGLAGNGGGYIDFASLRGRSSYTGMTVTGADVNDQSSATGVQFTGSWYPSVSVSGGSGGYSYAWTFTDNPYAFSMPVNTGSQAQVRHSISKFGFSGYCTLNCQVTDNTGHVVNRTVTVTINYTDPGAG